MAYTYDVNVGARLAVAKERIAELEKQQSECREAIEFFDRVMQATPEERAAVGADHVDWVIQACRKAAALTPPEDKA